MTRPVPQYAAIGDIHGCVNTLRNMLTRLETYGPQEYVFVGDYIDRGPDSKGVVQYLIDFSRTHTCVFLRGNHEQMMLDGKNNIESFSHWMRNGGRETLYSYGQAQMNFDLPSSHFHFFRNTRLVYETPDYVFVHGGMNPELSIAEQLAFDDELKDDFLWERAHLKADTSHWEKTLVFGHTPKPEVILEPKKIGIDTGCVYKNLPGMGVLTAVLLPEVLILRENCIDNPKPY